MVIPAQGSDQADEWLRLGFQAQMSGNLPAAQQHYEHALRLDPRHAVATNNLAIVFAQSNLINEALLTIERANILDDRNSVVVMNWGYMALDAERIDLAIEKATLAVAMDPKPETWMALASMMAIAGTAIEAIPMYNEILDKMPSHPVAGVNASFVQTLTDATPADLLKQRRRWYEANRFAGKLEPHDNDRSPDRPLRIGYVGGDFKNHSASFIFRHVLWNHTPAVEMYLYSTLPVDPMKDHTTKKFQELAGERWRDASAMSDEDLARQIRRDRIDILVDLAAHTQGGRLGVFTRKPAPVQVTAWGFAHGTGCPEIDYFFADPVAVPEAERGDFAEKIYDLPCVVTMDPPESYNIKGTSQPPYKRNGYITFGSYARYEKMSNQCLQTFAEILRRVPDAKMEFKDAAYRRPYSLRRIMALMPDVNPERLLFSIHTDHRDHLLAYQQADIILDPFPHTGGVVGLEQVYMGVPIVTRYGTQPGGRSTSSVLTAMGRTDWIAKTPEEYVDIAVRLADDPKYLAECRQTLRADLLKSPVIEGYAAAVEAAYRDIWGRWCKS